MGRLVVDITELVQWTGKLTGVPRVIDEIALRYSVQGNCMFVSWDNELHAYYEVNYESGKETNQRIVQESTAPSVSSPVLRIAKSAKRRSRVLQKGYAITKNVIAPRRTSSQLAKLGFSVRSDDVLLIMADWHGSDPEFINYVVALKKTGTKLIQMVYDILPIVAPQYSGHSTPTLTKYVNTLYPLCDLIISISQNTEQDVTEYLNQKNLHVPKIVTIRLGDDFKKSDKTPSAGTAFAFAQNDFLLCVGTVEARKNHTLLYYTYKLAHQRGIALPPVIIAGRKGWMSEAIYEIATTDPDTKDSLIFLHDASDEALAWLYEKCLFSIYPSFYEGWGLPIAESILYGSPCVASNTSSMPEIAGDLIQYFSPASSDECLDAIVHLLKPGELKKAKTRIAAYKPTSWQQTFNELSKNVDGV